MKTKKVLQSTTLTVFILLLTGFFTQPRFLFRGWLLTTKAVLPGMPMELVLNQRDMATLIPLAGAAPVIMPHHSIMMTSILTLMLPWLIA